MTVEVVPVYMLDQAIGELRRRAAGRECVPVRDAVDVMLELREYYGMDLEAAEDALVLTGRRERKQ